MAHDRGERLMFIRLATPKRAARAIDRSLPTAGRLMPRLGEHVLLINRKTQVTWSGVIQESQKGSHSVMGYVILHEFHLLGNYLEDVPGARERVRRLLPEEEEDEEEEEAEDDEDRGRLL